MKRLSTLHSARALLKIRKNYCLGYQELHEKYGDSVLITFPIKLFVTRDNLLIEDILKDELQRFGRSQLLVKAYSIIINNGILAQEGQEWKRSRKGIINTMSFSNIQDKRQTLREHISSLIPKQSYKNLNFTEIAKTYAFKNINKLVFADAFSENQDHFKEVVDRSVTILSKKQKNPLFYSRPDYRLAVSDLNKIRRIISSKIEQKKLPQFNHGHDRFSLEAKVGQVMNILAAGYETTASTAIWCLYFMIKHGVSSKDINKAINESLRLFPAVGVLLRKSHFDTDLKGVTIPKGAEVVCNLYSLHRHEEYWDKPNEFILDRKSETNKNYKPFGHGPNVCPGKALSLIELEELFIYLLENFNISFSQTFMDGFIHHRTDATIKPAHDLLIDLEPLT